MNAMISAILKWFGYVRKCETVSIDDYMRLRESSEELLNAYYAFKLTVRNSAVESPNINLPGNPDNVILLAEWRKETRKH